jgi:hypothetical protein
MGESKEREGSEESEGSAGKVVGEKERLEGETSREAAATVCAELCGVEPH